MRPYAVATCQRILLVVFAAFGSGTAIAAEEVLPPISYRLLFVPAEDIETWPRGNDKYLPVESDEFRSWVAAANRADTTSGSAATIREATYSARLDGEQLVDCLASWQVELRSERPGLVDLGKDYPAVAAPRWSKDPAMPVRLGYWGNSGERPDRAGLEVPRSERLQFTWSATCQRTETGFDIRCRFPPAVVTRLTLVLPEGMLPLINDGVVLESQQGSPHPAVIEPAENPKTGIDPEEPSQWVRWSLAIGQSFDGTVRIVNAEQVPPAGPPRASIAEHLLYEVSERGVELTATCELNDLDADGHLLSIPLPKGVSLVAATVDGRELQWTDVSAKGEVGTTVRLRLPESPASKPLNISLRAYQAIEIDQPWILPTVRPADVFWTSGSTQVSVSPSLDLRALTTTDCQRTSVMPNAKTADGSEAWSLIAVSPAAKIEVVLGSRQPRVSVSMGTMLEIGDPEITGRAVTRLQIQRGSLPILRAEVRPNWVVEAVQTIPAETLDAWHVDAEHGRQRLVLQLAPAVREKQELMVVVSGRFQRGGLLEPIQSDALAMLNWHDITTRRSLLSLRTAEPYIIESTDGLPILAATELTANDQLLFEQLGSARVYDLTEANADAVARIGLKRGNYETDIQIDVACTTKQVLTSYQLVCRPLTSSVEQLLVSCSEPIDENVEWTVKGSGARIAAKRVATDNHRVGRQPDGSELWELQLPRPSAKPVEIMATAVQPLSDRVVVPLLSLPEATHHSGRVVLHGPRNRPLVVEPQGLTPVSPPAASVFPEEDMAPGEPLRLCAAYRYETSQEESNALRPRLCLRPGVAGQARCTAVVNQLTLESFVAASGKGKHRATCHLKFDDIERIDVRLPPGAEHVTAKVGDQDIATAVELAASNTVSINLPREKGRCEVELCFETTLPALTNGSVLQPPLPGVDLPILTGEWIVTLPEGFQVLGDGTANLRGELNWRTRLFGPLGRPSGELPFGFTGWRPISQAGEIATGTVQPPSSQPDASLGGNLAGSIVNAEDTRRRRTDELVQPLEGWKSFRVPFVAKAPAPLVVVRPATTTIWALSLFLIGMVGGLRFGTRHRMWFITSMALAAALSLLLPITHAPLATGSFLGLLFSLIVEWPWRQPSQATPQGMSTRLTTAGVMAVCLTVALADVASGQLSGGDPATTLETEVATLPEGEDKGADAARIERVFVPSDANGRVEGDKVFISERFLQALLQSDQHERSTIPDWVVTRSELQGELTRPADQPRFVAGNWILICDIEVLTRDTLIVLPLIRHEAHWPATGSLDGIPIPLEWDQDGKQCTVRVREPGHYKLEIAFVPRTRSTIGHGSVDLNIPRLGSVTFTLTHPPEVTDPEVTGLTNQVQDKSASTITGTLDGSNRLVVLWAQPTDQPAIAAPTRVTELQWIHVAPQRIILAAKYLVEGVAPETLTIRADKRWHVISSGVAVLDDALKSVDGEHVLRVPISAVASRADSKRNEATLRCELLDTSPLGQLRLPRLEVLSLPIDMRSVAITADADLACQLVDGDLPSPGNESEFLGTWGSEPLAEPPQLVLEGAPALALLSLAVTPRAVESKIDEVLHVAAGRRGLRLQYRADVEPSDVQCFQYSLDVSSDVAIEEVLVHCGAELVPLRWVRLSSNRVNVFFGDAITEPYRLVVLGRMPGTAGGEHALPRITAILNHSASRHVQIYRDEEVLVQVQGSAAMVPKEEEPAEMPPRPWNARLLGRYRLDEKAPEPVRLLVLPNRVETAGESLTELARDENGWSASFNCHLTVRQGELDAFHLHIPSTWVGPYRVEGADKVDLSVTLVDDQRATLIVRLPKTLVSGEQLDLTIRGPLVSAPTASIAVPEITPEMGVTWPRYVVVPASLDGQPVTWTRVGVNSEELPGSLRSAGSESQRVQSFRVIDSPIRMVLKPQSPRVSTASVRLADTVVVTEENGGELCVTRFVIAPRGLMECVLKLPANEQLVEVRLEGCPALAHPLDSRSWAVQLGPPRLPQILEVVSYSTEPGGPIGWKMELDRPGLYAGREPIPVEMSLWSLQHPLQGVRPSVAGADLTNAMDQAALRLERLASIAEAATPAAIESGLPDGFDWFRPWAGQLAASCEEAQWLLEQSVRSPTVSQVSQPESEPLSQAANRIHDWMDKCREVWPVADIGTPSEVHFRQSEETAWVPAKFHGGNWIHFVAAGGSNRLAIEFVPEVATLRQVRGIGLLAIAGLAAVSLYLLRRPAVTDLLWRWPHVVGIVLGLTYWAWLRPSWLGLLIIAGSLWLLARSGWQGRVAEAEGLTRPDDNVRTYSSTAFR
jgi:hypothetical protein